MEKFRKRVSEDHGIRLTKKKTYRAMPIARNSFEGDGSDCYKKLWNYCLEIKQTNSNSSCYIRLCDLTDGDTKRFLRLFMCWEASKKGYQFCRKLIGGQLLTAIGIDANDGIIPLAYAVVEGETKESWIWFLECLKRNLSITPVDECQLTFILDKQKGLVPAFNNVFPAASHRFCVRHLHGNLKIAGFPGKAMKDALWAAVRATTVNSFKEALLHIRELDVQAFERLSSKNPSEWSRYSGYQSDEWLFEINGMRWGVFEQHKVDLKNHTCSCRIWDLSGIPCKHAIAAIWLKKGKQHVHEFVHPCYSVDAYLNAYSGSIKPLACVDDWPASQKEPPLPPLVKRKAGRPKNMRKKGQDELVKDVTKDGVHVKRSLIPLSCTRCKKKGHNARRCYDNPSLKEKLANPRKKVKAKKCSTTSKQRTTTTSMGTNTEPSQEPMNHPIGMPPELSQEPVNSDITFNIQELLGEDLDDFWTQASVMADSCSPLIDNSSQPVEKLPIKRVHQTVNAPTDKNKKKNVRPATRKY